MMIMITANDGEETLSHPKRDADCSPGLCRERVGGLGHSTAAMFADQVSSWRGRK